MEDPDTNEVLRKLRSELIRKYKVEKITQIAQQRTHIPTLINFVKANKSKNRDNSISNNNIMIKFLCEYHINIDFRNTRSRNVQMNK
jgi:hypothetical protein